MKTILITNDDGIHGPGLRPLQRELQKLGRVFVIVPDQERSGTSHSITLHKPLRVIKTGPNAYMLNGTPADCVRYGVLALIKEKIDMVVSGINTGPNLGQDVVYSGTVAGAREGALLGIPSFAVSVAVPGRNLFPGAAREVRVLAQKMLRGRFPGKVYLNINIPPKPNGIRITTLGQRIYDERIDCRTDPRGLKYYWLAGHYISGLCQPGTDIDAVENCYISVTPLEFNPVAKSHLKFFRSRLGK